MRHASRIIMAEASASPVRLSFCLNAGPRQGAVLAAAVVKPEHAALVQVALNKLKLKKKAASQLRLFVWKTGVELARDAPLAGMLRNDDLVAVSLGEAYAGGARPAAAAEESLADAPPPVASAAAGASDDTWHVQAPGALAVVRWRDAATMNRSLGRMSTLLEHPTLCAAASGAVVAHEAQRGLPSNKYLGHNLYEETLTTFERLAADDASDAERGFLGRWRQQRGGAPRVVISFVVGARDTLAHELCHACYALDGDGYRAAVDGAWDEWREKMAKWMRDLGYHESRHADEFAAYVLTEPAAFWRGRLTPADLKDLRQRLTGARATAGAALKRSGTADELCEECVDLL